MQKRHVLNSPSLLGLKKHRRKIIFMKTALSFVVLSCIFALFAYISNLEKLNISSVEIEGNKVMTSEDIRPIVEKEIAGNYFWFFPKTNIFLYPKKDITKEIFNISKRVKGMSFRVKDNKTLVVSVVERTALYTWCGDVPPAVDSKEKPQCYFLDESGYIFNEAPYFSGEVYFKFYGSIPFNTGIPSGLYFSPANFIKLAVFKRTLALMGMKPAIMYLQDDGDVRITLSSKTQAVGPEILFKISSDFETVAGNLDAVLSTEPLLSGFKDKYSSLLYIDLRFGNKVYYKFK